MIYFLASLWPIFLCLLILIKKKIFIFHLLGIELVSAFTPENKLIITAFSISCLAANLYNYSRKLNREIILGNIYFTASSTCVLAADYISMFVSIEFMMLAASMLLFISTDKRGTIAARYYFLTHIINGSLILIATVYLNFTNNNHIDNLSQFIINKDEGYIFYLLLFVGLIINAGAFPFSNWLIKTYPYVSNGSLTYLISFTTKVSLILLIKIFSGFKILQFIGIALMIYSCLNAYFENNLKRLISYLTLIQIGIILIFISISDAHLSLYILNYIFIHILYKSLFILITASYIDQTTIDSCKNLMKTNNNFFNFSLLISVLMMINFPLTMSFNFKIFISNYLSLNLHHFILFFNVIIISLLPLKEWQQNSASIKIELNNFNQISLLIPIFSLILVHYNFYIDDFSPIFTQINNKDYIFQLILILIGIIFSLFIRLNRNINFNFNFDLINIIANIFYYFINIKNPFHLFCSHKITFCRNLFLFKKNLINVHNLNVAILVVFSLLIALIYILNMF